MPWSPSPSQRAAEVALCVAALLYAAGYYLCRGIKRAAQAAYWGAVALICAAIHGILGDDDVARP